MMFLDHILSLIHAGLLQLHPNLATADKIQIWVLINGKIDMMIVMLKDMVWYHITVIIWIADEDDAVTWKREAKKRSGAGSKWAASLEETPHLTLIPSLTYQWNEKISVLIYSQYLQTHQLNGEYTRGVWQKTILFPNYFFEPFPNIKP